MDRKLWAEARAIAARHDPSRGEDLAQDLAVTMLESGAAPRHAPAWLERVARNAAIDTWRVESRRAELLPRHEAVGSGGDPEAILICRERRRLVREALGRTAAPAAPGRAGAISRRPVLRRGRRARGRRDGDRPNARASGAGGVAGAVGRAAVAVLPSRRSGQHAGGGLHRGAGSARAPGAGGRGRRGDGRRRGSDAALRACQGDGGPGRHAGTQESRAGPARRLPRPSPRAPPVQELSFENDTVEGDLAGPDSVFVPRPTGDRPALADRAPAPLHPGDAADAGGSLN